MKKRIATLLLSIVMLISMLPVQAFATEAADEFEPVVPETSVAAEETTEATTEEVTEETTQAVEEETEETTAAPQEELPAQEPEETEETEELPSEEPTVPEATEELEKTTVEVQDTSALTLEWDENGEFYRITTFADLQELTSRSFSEYTNACYDGTDAFTIESDITVPENLFVDFYSVEDASLIIPAGVTLTLDGEIRGYDITVAGALVNNNWMGVNGDLTITGQVRLNGQITAYEGATLTGQENITYGKNAAIQVKWNSNNKADFLDQMAQAAALPEHWNCTVRFSPAEDVVLNQSVTIPDGVYLWLEGDHTVTLAEGCTLRIDSDSNDVRAHLVINGTLENNGEIDIFYDDGGKITFNSGSTYAGDGMILVNVYQSQADYSLALPGLDASMFDAQLHGEYWYLQNIAGKERLAAPKNLTWHKQYTWDDATEQMVLKDYIGSVAFQLDEPNDGNVDIILYVENDGTWEYYSNIGLVFGDEITGWISADDFASEGLDSGKYYFTVQSLPDEDSEYAPSEVVQSDVFTYVKPSTQLPTPTGLQIQKRNDHLVGSWNGQPGKYEVRWYFTPTLEDYDPEENDWANRSIDTYESTQDILDWQLTEYGNGYYYFQVCAISTEITTALNSEWSAYSEPYYYFSPVAAVQQQLQQILDNYAVGDADGIRAAMQDVDGQMLSDALKTASDGEILYLYSEVENMAGDPADVVISSGFTAFAADQAAVIGANLMTPAAAGQPIRVAIGKPAKTYTLGSKYDASSAVSFSVSLENVTQQTLPVLLTLPVPTGGSAGQQVLLQHGSNGSVTELKPVDVEILEDAAYVTFVLDAMGEYTMAEKAFTQADFLAEYNAALEAGEYRYVLNKKVTLTENAHLACGEDYFQLEIADGGALIVEKGVTCIVDSYLFLDGQASVTVKGKMVATDSDYSQLEVGTGTFTIAEGGQVDAPFIALNIGPDAHLIGWTDEKTAVTANVYTMEEVRDMLAVCDNYHSMYVNMMADEALLAEDLYIPDDACLYLFGTDLTVTAGTTVDNDGTLGCYYDAVVTIEEGATLINRDYIKLYDSTLNMYGYYRGMGELDLEESTVNGMIISVELDCETLAGGETCTLSALAYPDVNAELVWSVKAGSEYVELIPNGNTAVVKAKNNTGNQIVTIKVSTADEQYHNLIDINLVNEHAYVRVEQEPTYTQWGGIFYECECGEFYVEEWYEPLGLPKPVVKVTNAPNGMPVVSWADDGEATGYEIHYATSKTGTYSYLTTVYNTEAELDLPAGKTYYVKVKALCEFDETVNSAFSTPAKVVVKCAQPEIGVSIDHATGKPSITWNAVDGAKKYDVYRATKESGTYSKVKTVTTTEYLDTGASVGKTYFYKVKAVASSSTYNSDYSNVLSSYTICAQPAFTVQLNAASGKPVISWSKVSGASKYQILRATEEDGAYTLLAEQTAVTFTDTTAVADTQYFYKVNAIATNADNNSVEANPVSIVASIAQPVIKSTTSDPVSGYPVLTWDAVEGASCYLIQRATSSTGTYEDQIIAENAYFTDENTEVGKTYYYKVVAITAQETESAASAYKSGKRICAMPQLMMSLDVATGKPSLNWETITGAKKYDVYRATKENGTYSKIKTVTTTEYLDTGASVGKTYFYKVKAVAVSSSYNSGYSGIGYCYTICAQPAVTVQLNTTSGKPVVSWKKITGASKYEILRATEENGVYESLAIQTAVTYTDAAALADTQYFYKVNAIATNADNNSVDGNPVAIVASVSQPKITTSAADAAGLPVITWDAVEGAATYEISRATKSTGTYEVIGTTAEVTYTDTTAAGAKTYYYKVTAITAIGTRSAISSYKSGKCICAQPVVSVSIDAAKGKPSLSWNAVDGAKKYDVYRATKENGTYSKIKTVTTTSYLDTGASVGKTYFYKVKAVAASTTYNSNYSDVVSSYAVCARPVVTIDKKISTGEPIVSWKKVTGAVKYQIYRSGSELGEFELLAEQTAVTFVDTTATPGMNCYYKVMAIAADPIFNSDFGATPFVIVATCAQPVIKSAKADTIYGVPVLEWNAVADATSYKVLRATSVDGYYTTIAEGAGLMFTDTSATPGKNYYYKVIACADGSYSDPSAYKKVTCKCEQPWADSGFDTNTFRPMVVWDEVDGAVKYEVYRATSLNGTYSKVKTLTTTEYLDTTASVGKTYFYKVRAVGSTSAATSTFSPIVVGSYHKNVIDNPPVETIKVTDLEAYGRKYAAAAYEFTVNTDMDGVYGVPLEATFTYKALGHQYVKYYIDVLAEELWNNFETLDFEFNIDVVAVGDDVYEITLYFA